MHALTPKTVFKICSVLIVLLFIWAYYYTSLMSHTSPYIPFYSNISNYILPDKNTSLIVPKSQCHGTVFLVVVVVSAVPNIKARDTVRKTWMKYITSQQGSIRVFFMLGKSSNEDENAAVVRENYMHSDIIQENFLDTYKNLTLKSVMLLKWVNQNCRNAKYVMKTDDDVLVNLPNLLKLLESDQNNNLLIGNLLKSSFPDRDRNSRFYVPEYMFPGPTYPPYLTGSGYVIPVSAVRELYRAAMEIRFFYLEDLFITGMCASKIGLQPIHNAGFLFKDHDAWANCCVLNSSITAYNLIPEEMSNAWENCYEGYISHFSCQTTSACFTVSLYHANILLVTIVSTFLLSNFGVELFKV